MSDRRKFSQGSVVLLRLVVWPIVLLCFFLAGCGSGGGGWAGERPGRERGQVSFKAPPTSRHRTSRPGLGGLAPRTRSAHQPPPMNGSASCFRPWPARETSGKPPPFAAPCSRRPLRCVRSRPQRHCRRFRRSRAGCGSWRIPRWAWVVEASGRRSVELRLHLVSDLRVWRSVQIPVQIPPELKWAWPASPPDGAPLAALELDEGELLREIEGELWLESRRGRQMIDYGTGGLELLEFRPWDQWGLSWVERWSERPAQVARGAAVLRRDTAMVLSASDLPPGEGDVVGWSVWRGSSLAPMPLRRATDDWVASYVAAPRVWDLPDGWGVCVVTLAVAASSRSFRRRCAVSLTVDPGGNNSCARIRS